METVTGLKAPEWETAIEAALGELRGVLGDRVTAADAVREHHSHGESSHAPGLPDLVCFPRTTDEVSAIVKASARHRLPVVPFGAGTSLEGNVHAMRGGISIDMRQMNGVLRVSSEDMDAKVEAGISRIALQKALENTGLTFFIDPGADATIGGMASTRASGTTAVRYGTMRENVLGMTVVLADGGVIKTGSRARKSAAGYDLTHLFVGSEGTLAVITEVTLRLHPLPEKVAVAVCSFETVEGAVETVILAIQFGIGLARIEFLDDKQVEVINRFSKINLPVMPTLFFGFHGMNNRDLGDRTEMLQSLAAEHRGQGFKWKTNLEDMEELWGARHNAYFATHALVPGAKVLVTDVCVPLSRLAECITETKNDLAKVSFQATIVGHVGDGNFHVLCVLDPNEPSQMSEGARFSERTVQRALEMGGTCTGEHGIGVGKMKFMREEHGDALEVMRAIKKALDPDNRMNPGKIVDMSAG